MSGLIVKKFRRRTTPDVDDPMLNINWRRQIFWPPNERKIVAAPGSNNWSLISNLQQNKISLSGLSFLYQRQRSQLRSHGAVLSPPFEIADNCPVAMLATQGLIIVASNRKGFNSRRTALPSDTQQCIITHWHHMIFSKLTLEYIGSNAIIAHMKNFNIRKVDEAVYVKIKTMAAAKGRSMESELRDIVTKAAEQVPAPRNIARSIRARVMKHGGIELDLPTREMPRETVKFDA